MSNLLQHGSSTLEIYLSLYNSAFDDLKGVLMQVPNEKFGTEIPSWSGNADVLSAKLIMEHVCQAGFIYNNYLMLR